jgi:hypothetical protein
LGDLCHAKSTLRLSLNINPSSETPATETSDNVDTHILPNITQLIFTNDTTPPPISTLTADPIDDSIKLFDSILPTPSCTGSLDSLSSSSGSSDHRPPSFTTFGKKQNINHFLSSNNQNSQNNTTNEIEYMTTKIPSIVLIEDCEQQTNDVVLMHKYANNKMNRSTGARLSDSTDEDSGIENMSRLISK